MTMKSHLQRNAAIGLACCLGAAPAAAQEIQAQRGSVDNPNEVMARARPGYDATGLRVGSFLVYPHLDTRINYDDNVYASDRFKRADVSGIVEGGASIRSDWNRHSLSVETVGRVERFAKETAQSSETGDVAVNGVVDVTRRAAVTVNARLARIVESRGSQGDALIGSTAPLYNMKQAGAGVHLKPGRLDVTVNATVSDLSYVDVRLNGIRYDQAYRDYREVIGGARAAYAFSPNLSTFVSGSVNDVKYKNRTSGFDLDSKGYSVLAGVDVALSRLVVGSFGIGWISQSFQDARFRSVSGLAYDGKLVWNPTTLVSVTLTGRSTIRQSGIVGVPGVLERSATLRADYELLRNLIVHAQGSTINRNYRGLDRNDGQYLAGVGAKYLLNRHLDLDVSYEHARQGSSGSGQRDFAANRVMFAVRLKR